MSRVANTVAGELRRGPTVKPDSRHAAIKFRRRDADDRDRVPVDPYGAAENRSVAVKIVLPQPVADNRRESFGLVAVFVANKRAAQNRLYPQDIEVVSRDQLKPCGIGVLSLADRGRRRLM